MSYDIVDENGVSQASGTPSGSWCADTVDLCLPDGCYELTQTFTWSGYGWSLAGASGSSTASSGSYTTTNILIGSGVSAV